MRTFFSDFKKEFYDLETKGARLVFFNITVSIALLYGIMSTILVFNTSILSGQRVPIMCLAALALITFYMANRKGQLELATDLLITISSFVLYPTLFFSGGGIYSGMISWFSFGTIFIFMLVSGWKLYVYAILNYAAIVICFLLAFYDRDMVAVPASRAAVYIDMAQGLIATTLAIGQIIKMQTILYEKQMQKIEEKNEEIREVTIRATESKKKAQEESMAKSHFLANMSHEIRTPINSLMGLNEMIMRQSTEQNIIDLSKDIRTSTESLLGIVNEILDFSRIKSGKMELMLDEYGLSSMLHDTTALFLIKAKEKGLKFEVEVAPDLPSVYYGDELRLKQVLTNLLSNAVKYTKEGGIKLFVDGTVSEKVAIIRFEVRDTGIGIKEQDIGKLFEAFERIDEKQNRSIEGTGLGMAITWNLLQMMDSTLEIQSEYGVGSTFYFDLVQRVVDFTPIGKFDIADRINQQLNAKRSTFLAPNVSVLMVDDNAMNRKVFRKLLEETKVQIDDADNGYSCLEMVKKKHYDMIFMDHMMPELDGVETFLYMTEMQNNMCKGVPVIVLTANAISGSKEKYLEIGFDDYISKPINPEELERVMMEQLKKAGIEVEMQQVSLGDADARAAAQEKKDTSSLPELEGFDWEYGMLHFPTAEMLWESVLDFGKTGELLKREIADLYEQIDSEEGLKNYRIKVHALKSNLALFGYMQLSAVAKILEFAAADGDTARIHQLHPILMEEFDTLLFRLQPYQSPQEDKPRMSDEAWIFGMLSTLRFSLEELNYDNADNLMEMINANSYEEGLQEKINKLSQLVMNLEDENAIRLIDEITSAKQETSDTV